MTSQRRTEAQDIESVHDLSAVQFDLSLGHNAWRSTDDTKALILGVVLGPRIGQLLCPMRQKQSYGDALRGNLAGLDPLHLEAYVRGQ